MAVLAITPGEVSEGAGPKKIFRSGKAGVVLDAGDMAYFDETVGTWKKANARTSAATAAVRGMCLNSAGVNQPVDILEEGEIIVGATAAIVVGQPYQLAPSDGEVVPCGDVLLLAADFASFVGIGAASNRMKVGPLVSGQQIP